MEEERSEASPQIPGLGDNIFPIDEFLTNDDPTGGVKLDDGAPILLSKPKPADHVTRLYQMCDRLRSTPIFEFESLGPSQFSAKLRLVSIGCVFDAQGYGSKKEAKNAVSAKACTALQNFPISKDSASPKPLTTPDASDSPPARENWIGSLLEYCNARGLPKPTYHDYAVGKQFAAVVTIEEPETPAFGGVDKLYANKKSAKIAAATEAVQWLMARGYLSGNNARRVKTGIPENAHAEEGGASAQSLKPSYAQQVTELAHRLGIGPPEYRLIPELDGPALYSGSVQFQTIHQPVGSVDRIYGKKKAKEELAKVALAFLDVELQKRLACV